MKYYYKGDRFTAGMLAGVGASLLMNGWNFLAYYVLKMTHTRLLDWGAILTLGLPPKNPAEALVGLFTHMVFTAILGVLFAYFIPLVNSRHYYLKGWAFGLGSWMVIYFFIRLFQVPGLEIMPIGTAITNLIGSSLFGLSLAYFLKETLRRNKV